MIYTTGTIAGNGNTLTGTGTNFTAAGTLIRNGCTVIVLTSPPQAFQITGVTSATQLAVSPAVNPAIPAGTRYAILLSDSLSVDGLALNVAETLNMYLAYMSGFADVMTGTGNVTITINGVSVTVPTQKSLVQKGTNGAVPVKSGGTGATTESEARDMLGLGNAATKNVHTSSYGDTAGVGVALQVNADFRSVVGYDFIGNFPRGVTGGIQTASKYGAAGDYIGLLSVRGWQDTSGSAACWQMAVNHSLQALRIPIYNTDGNWYLQTFKIWNQRNTTVDANGFIKQASPVVQIRADGFSVNDESEGVTVTRQSEGVYLIDGCMGLNADAAWGGPDGGFEIPLDRNKQPLIWLDYKVCADGSVVVKTYHRTYPDAPEFARNERAGYKNGDPVDIPAGLFISVRVEMPENSVYNQKLKAAEEAMIKEQAALAIKAAENAEQDVNPDNQ